MTATKMFCPKEHELRYGKMVTPHKRLEALRPVEAFFLEVMEDYPTVPTYDCNFNEAHYFWTMNYTNLSDCFYMHPLQFDLMHQQMTDALIHGSDDGYDFKTHYGERILKDQSNKYNDIKSKTDYKAEVLVVLPGTNIYDKTVSLAKLRMIVENYGKHAIIKPHPLTNKDHLEDIKKSLLPSARILDPKDDLYHYMQKVDLVFTTHSSESALNAVCLDKVIQPVDKYQARHSGSFSALSRLLFSAIEPEPIINRIFNDYRSGLIHPEIHKDWQDRIVQYLDYIHIVREHFKTAYMKDPK